MNMKTISLELNEVEVKSIIAVLDMALKAGGLAASDAVVFAQKISRLIKEQETVKTEDPK